MSLDAKALPINAQYAQFLVKKQIKQDISHINPSKLPKSLATQAPSKADDLPGKHTSEECLVKPETLKVGIIGAGIAGLYTAHILDVLGIQYEILEASDRVGGRIFTKYFTPEKEKHDYYDVGAMRFPHTRLMER